MPAREVPITFRDRRVGQSKMSRRIIVEALVVVVQLRIDELRGRAFRRRPPSGGTESRVAPEGQSAATAASATASPSRRPRAAEQLVARRVTWRRPRRPGRRGRVTAAEAARLGAPAAGEPDRVPETPGVRVVLDARPLQEPDRAPLTAQYLDALLRARRGSTRGRVVRAPARLGRGRPDRSAEGLDVVGRRLLPPTRLLRSGALTIDPFLLSGASLGAAWRAERGGAAGAVYHAAGGSIPLATGLPLVVTLLDLAPWELPGAYQRSRAAFGQRLRGRLLRDAAAVIVGTDAVGRAARRLLRIRRDRIHVVRSRRGPIAWPWSRSHRSGVRRPSPPPIPAASRTGSDCRIAT